MMPPYINFPITLMLSSFSHEYLKLVILSARWQVFFMMMSIQGLVFVPFFLMGNKRIRHIRRAFINAGYAILVVVILLAICVTSCYFSRDPGIVPRDSHPPEKDFNYESSASVHASRKYTPSLQFPMTKEVHVKGLVVRAKYCDTYMLHRPLHRSHCSICNNCMEKFDHHCPQEKLPGQHQPSQSSVSGVRRQQ